MYLLLDLFLTFAKIGLFTFGGGYAMIPLIQRETAEKHGWSTDEDILEVLAIAESTPGPIAINCATFTGYKKAGFLGALIATVGMVVPSFAIIFAISRFLDHFLEITVIAHGFQGIKIAVGILILDAGLTMLKKMQKKPLSRLILAASCTAMLLINFFSWNISSIALLVTAGIVSLAVFAAGNRKGGARV